MKYFSSIILIFAALIGFSPKNYAQTSNAIVVVVPYNSTITSLNSQEVANIFLARTNRFPNGEKTVPVELKNDEIKQKFYQQISGKTPRQLMSYWTALVFTGKGRPPRGYGDFQSLIQKLAGSDNAITYLTESQVTEQMRVVYRFES